MFGEFVRRHRQRLGLTQQELADRAGLGVRSIRKIEAGRVHTPRPPTVRLLADTFRLSGAERDEFCVAAAQGTTVQAEQPHARSHGEPPLEVEGRPKPMHLPPPVPHFIGREAELRRLVAARGIVVLSGTAGVGKTALAVHFGHLVSDRFPDGALYANLRGFDPSGSYAAPAEVLTGFLDALGVPAGRIPPTLAEQVNLYRSLLSDRRVLVLLDNVREADQVRPLLPGAGAGLVVITSRSQLAGLIAVEGAVPLALEQLTVAEGRRLLAGRLGAERIVAEADAVDEIVEACARLPLALVIVAARAATHRRFPLASLAAELRDSRLDALDGGEPGADVRAAFSWSYRALSPDAASLLRRLGLHPGPDLGVAAAAGLAGLAAERVRPLLGELSRANLLSEHSPGRYSYHDLLRAYAEERAWAQDPEPVRQAALGRLLDYYLHSTVAADRRLHPDRDTIPLWPAAEGIVAESFTEEEPARQWLAVEAPALVAAVELAARTGFDRHACALARALSETLDRLGQWHRRIVTQRAAVAAARRLSDREEEALAHRGLGGSYVKAGDLTRGRVHLTHALRLYERLGDELGQGHTHRNLSGLAEAQGRYAAALKHGQRAYALFERVDHWLGTGRALNIVGWNHALLGRYDDAIRYCRRALALQREILDRPGQADTLDSLGYAHHQRGEYSLAVEFFQAALEKYRETGGRLGEAQSLGRLGDCYHSAGEFSRARSAWREALECFESLDHADAATLRAKLAPSPPVPAR